MIGTDVRAKIEQCVLGNPELDNSDLRLNFGLAKGGTLRLGDILRLGGSSSKLDRSIAVTVLFAASDDLNLIQLQDGNRHMPSVRLEQAGHSDLLRDHAGAHDQTPPQRHGGNIPRACSPIPYLRAPPGLVLPFGEAAGTQPGAYLRRYHPSLLRASRPRWPSGQLDLHVDPCGKIELHQSIDRLRRRLNDIEQPLVGPHLELLARLLVDVRRAVHGEFLNARRQRNGSTNKSTRTASRIGNVAGGLIKHSMIERLQANPDILRFHVPTDAKEPASPTRPGAPTKPYSKANRATLIQNRAVGALYYFVISATTPAPTVRPPSRIAKRRPGSIAIGAISLTPMFTLSPGMTISVPSGSRTSPVTSVVRK